MNGPTRKRDGIGVRWGIPCSALFHLAIVALVLLVLPEPRKPKALPKEIPVEVVREAPKKKPAAKPKTQARKIPPKPKPKPKQKPKPKPKLAKPKKPDEGLNLAKKIEPRPAPAKPKQSEKQGKAQAKAKPPAKSSPAEKKPTPKPATPPREPPKRADKAASPKPKPPPAAKEPQLALGPGLPVLRPKPAPPPKPRTGSLKIPPDLGAVPLPNAKRRKLVGQWILTPLTLNINHRCGKQRVTGVMNLVSRRVRDGGAEIQYLAEIRTTIQWERCRPEGALRKLVLIQRGDRVYLLDAQGVTDHGLMRGNVMILRDSLGDSIWHLRR
jgi:hypothetical protein